LLYQFLVDHDPTVKYSYYEHFI